MQRNASMHSPGLPRDRWSPSVRRQWRLSPTRQTQTCANESAPTASPSSRRSPARLARSIRWPASCPTASPMPYAPAGRRLVENLRRLLPATSASRKSKRAKADGHTLLVVPAGNLTINPTLMPNFRFQHRARIFAPIPPCWPGAQTCWWHRPRPASEREGTGEDGPDARPGHACRMHRLRVGGSGLTLAWRTVQSNGPASTAACATKARPPRSTTCCSAATCAADVQQPAGHAASFIQERQAGRAGR